MATNNDGRIGIIITGDESQLRRATQNAERDVERMASEIGNEGEKVEAIFKKMGLAVGAFFSISQAASMVKQIAAVRGQYQQLEVAFETMLQSQEKSNKLMRELTDTAARTPFGLQDVTGGAKQLLAYGFAAEEVNQTLIELGNIAAGLSVPLNDLVYLYGTTRTQGRVYTQDMRQFMGRGISLAEELSKQLGKSKNEINAMVTAGKIGFPEVEKAIKSMSGEGGKFYNLMEKQSHTITGQISNIEDAFQMMLNDIGQKSEGAINSGLGAVSSLIENYEKVGRVLLNVAEIYGVYKMACMAASAAQAIEAAATSGVTMAQLVHTKAVKALTIAQKALNKTMLSNPYVLLATAVISLGVAMAKLAMHTSNATKAQNELNAARKNVGAGQIDAEYVKETGQLEQLKSALEAADKGTKAWQIARNQIIESYSKYDKGLAEEIDKTGKLGTKYDELRAKMAEAGKVRAYNSFMQRNESVLSEEIDNTINAVNNALQKAFKNGKEEAGYNYGSAMKSMVDYIVGDDDTLDSYLRAVLDSSFKVSQSMVEDARKASAALKTLKQDAMSAFGVTDDMLSPNTPDEGKKVEESNSDVAAELKARKAALEQLTQLGKTEAKKRATMTYEERQAQINAMAEGTERAVLQIRLDGEKERAALQEQQDETLKLLRDKEKTEWISKHPGGDAEKDYKTTIAELPADWAKLYDTAYSLIAEAEQNKLADAMNAMAESESEIISATEAQIEEARDAYFSSYGSYAEKRNALIAQYDRAIIDAEGKGDAGEWLKKKLEADKKAALEAFDMQNDNAYRYIFGDPSKMTSSAISKALDMARAKLKLLNKDAQPDAWKALVEAIERLEGAQDVLGFQSTSTGLESVLVQMSAVHRMQMRINAAKEEGAEADEAEIKLMEEYLATAQKRLKESLSLTAAGAFADALSEAADAMQEIAEMTNNGALADAGKALAEVSKTWTNIANATAKGGPVAGFAQAAVEALKGFINQFVTIAKQNAALKEAAAAYREFARSFSEGLTNQTGDKVFGENAIKRVTEAYRLAAEARDRYLSAGSWMYGTWDTNKGALIARLKEDNKKIVKELTGSRKTATLAEMFPGIFDENGDLVLDKAKEALSVLESRKDSSTLYQSLKEAVEQLEVFEENVAIVDDYLNGMFNNLGDNVVDAILSGADAFDVLKDSAADFMNEFAKDYIKSILMTDDFKAKYTSKLREAIATGDAATLAAVVSDMNIDLESRIAEATEVANKLDEASSAAGINTAAARQDSNTGIAQASQDSVNELNGRFTAIQMYTANIAGDVAEMSARSSQILQQLMGIRTNTDDIAAGVTAIRRDVAEIKETL